MININYNSKQANILVIDDEPANLRLVEKLLQVGGFTNIITSTDPLQALPLYQEHDTDLILLDLNMPILDGYGVMKLLKQNSAEKLPPILILTAQNTQTYVHRAFEAGAQDYVTKPFDAKELLSRVNNLLDTQIAHKYMRHQNEILEQKVSKRTQEINETRLQIVRRLGLASEYRDNETGLHIIRMSKIAMIIAKSAGYDDEFCDLILNASPMHDIGKIGIPDRILLKPGKFEPDEWRIMQEHVQIGADILSGDSSDLLLMAHEIALTHHEKYNGQGYPNGLVGENIPIVGRITALADVFDALTSKRPYKESWTVEKAVKLIQEERGEHFDPKLVDAFLESLEQIIEIKQQHAEPE